jgi:PD-(D/E)XK endonuclease
MFLDRYKKGSEPMGKRNAGDRKPTGRAQSKDRGDLAEMQFMVAAASRGFAVAKPYGDNEKYDLILDVGRRLWRVQVKSSAARHHRGFAVRASWRTSYRQISYKPSQVDFMAVTIVGEGIWYVIPVRALAGRLTINLYPFGSNRGSRNGFEKYREGWDLFGGGKPRVRKGSRKRGGDAPAPAKKAGGIRSRIGHAGE